MTLKLLLEGYQPGIFIPPKVGNFIPPLTRHSSRIFQKLSGHDESAWKHMQQTFFFRAGRRILSPCTAGTYPPAPIKRVPEMRKGAHLIIGVLAFLGYAYLLGLLRETTNVLFLLGLFAVVTGSIMPDILEAPTSWRHRGIFHSKQALKCMVGTFGITAAIGLLPSPLIPHASIVYGLSCFALGYLFHLLADSTTKRGLPE